MCRSDPTVQVHLLPLSKEGVRKHPPIARCYAREEAVLQLLEQRPLQSLHRCDRQWSIPCCQCFGAGISPAGWGRK